VNALLCVREFRRKIRFGRRTAALDVGLELVTGLLRDAMRIRAGLGQSLFVGGDRGVALVVQTVRLGDVAGNPD
jgi:hypothetical protein